MLDLLGFDRYTIVPVLALCSFKKCLLYHTSNIWLLLRSKVVSGKWMDGLEGEISLKRWLRGKMRALVLHFSQIRDVFSWILQIHCMKVHKHFFLFTHRITEGFFFLCSSEGKQAGSGWTEKGFLFSFCLWQMLWLQQCLEKDWDSLLKGVEERWALQPILQAQHLYMCRVGLAVRQADCQCFLPKVRLSEKKNSDIFKQLNFNRLKKRQINSTCSQSIAYHPSFRRMIDFQFIIQSVFVDSSL